MLENRKVLTAIIGYIIGIIMGLYCKISIVLFYVVIYLIYSILSKEKEKANFKLFSFRRYFRYLKIIFNNKVMKIIIIFSIISNTIVLFQNYKYDNLYKNLDGQYCNFKGIVVSIQENRCKVKIINDKYKGTYLYIYLKDNTNTEYGDKIDFSGKYLKPKKRSNYKGFDNSEYLKTLKIYGTVNVKDLKIISKEEGNTILKYTNMLCCKIKQKIQNSKIPNDEKSILCGILLGDKSKISEEMANNFSESNISHILAVSGMHVSYIIVLSSFIFNKLIGKHYSKIISSIIIIIYMCIVEFTPSVVRACITGIIAIMSNFFYRKNDIWEDLSIALFVILVYNPFLIRNVGLQLSFAGTLGIIIFQKKFQKWINDFLDKINRRAIRKNKRFIKFIVKILNSKLGQFVLDFIIVTISATLFVSPIVLISFNKINISSLIISILIGGLIGPIVILGIVFVIIKIDLVEIILTFFLKILVWIAEFGSNMPLNQIYFITPNILQIIIYYIFILTINIILNIKLQKNPNMFQIRIKNIISFVKYKIKLNKRKFISILLIVSVLYSFILIIPQNLKIHFVDVGQGDCSLIVTPKNKTILVDGGGSEKEGYNIRQKCFNAIFVR